MTRFYQILGRVGTCLASMRTAVSTYAQDLGDAATSDAGTTADACLVVSVGHMFTTRVLMKVNLTAWPPSQRDGRRSAKVGSVPRRHQGPVRRASRARPEQRQELPDRHQRRASSQRFKGVPPPLDARQRLTLPRPTSCAPLLLSRSRCGDRWPSSNALPSTSPCSSTTSFGAAPKR